MKTSLVLIALVGLALACMIAAEDEQSHRKGGPRSGEGKSSGEKSGESGEHREPKHKGGPRPRGPGKGSEEKSGETRANREHNDKKIRASSVTPAEVTEAIETAETAAAVEEAEPQDHSIGDRKPESGGKKNREHNDKKIRSSSVTPAEVTEAIETAETAAAVKEAEPQDHSIGDRKPEFDGIKYHGASEKPQAAALAKAEDDKKSGEEKEHQKGGKPNHHGSSAGKPEAQALAEGEKAENAEATEEKISTEENKKVTGAFGKFGGDLKPKHDGKMQFEGSIFPTPSTPKSE